MLLPNPANSKPPHIHGTDERFQSILFGTHLDEEGFLCNSLVLLDHMVEEVMERHAYMFTKLVTFELVTTLRNNKKKESSEHRFLTKSRGLNSPAGALEVAFAEVGLAKSDVEELASNLEDTDNFVHLLGNGADQLLVRVPDIAAIAHQSVHGALVDHNVERVAVELEIPDIHLDP